MIAKDNGWDKPIILVVAVQHHRNRQMWALGLKVGEETKVVTGFRLDVKESTLKWAQRFIDRGEAYTAAEGLGLFGDFQVSDL